MELDTYMAEMVQSVNADANEYILRLIKIYGCYASRQVSRQIRMAAGTDGLSFEEEVEAVISETRTLLPNVSEIVLVDRQGNRISGDGGDGEEELSARRAFISLCQKRDAPVYIVMERKPYWARICEAVPSLKGWFIIMELTADV